MKVLQASIAGLLLDGAFESNLPADLYHDKNAVGPSAFLPERDDRAINHIKPQNETQWNKTAIVIIKSQKQVPTSSIDTIGVMESIEDFSSLMVNQHYHYFNLIVDHK